MGKSSLKKNANTSVGKLFKRISQKDFKSYVTQKHMKEGTSLKKLILYKQQLAEISNQETFECSVCLQIYLRPVITPCGHIFCLSCMQQLAKNHYACGICHDDQPTFQIKVDKTVQQLVNLYLSKCSAQQKSRYQNRQKQFQAAQADRSVGVINSGEYVDFWCQDQKLWKSGLVDCIDQNGIVSLKEDSKTSKNIQINILSRRIARHRCFTKEPIIRLNPMMHHHPQPINMFGNQAMRPSSHQMIGMPFFFNFYGGFEPNSGMDGNIFSYLRRLGNQFPF